MTPTTQVLADGGPIPIAEGLGVVNGGHRLLRAGQVDITAAAEGFSWEERPEFYYRFGVRRNPRTLAGVTADGHLLLATVDGRQPGWSGGASFAESARIMQELGAVEAVKTRRWGLHGHDRRNLAGDPTIGHDRRATHR